jgi:hypothetical protein
LYLFLEAQAKNIQKELSDMSYNQRKKKAYSLTGFWLTAVIRSVSQG